ncbi:MAG: hypothetical protein ABFD54_04420 [Armatimonadota bacterium]
MQVIEQTRTCATCYDGVGDRDRSDLYCLPRQELVPTDHTCELHTVEDRGEVES